VPYRRRNHHRRDITSKEPCLVPRELDAAGLIGKHLFIIGPTALYTYEPRAGVLFENGFLATNDFDES
jgi:Nucleotidyltransferase